MATIGGWIMGLKGRVARGIRTAAAVVVAALLLSACTGPQVVAANVPTQVSGSLPAAMEKSLGAAVTDAMKLAGASGAVAGVWAPWAGSWTTAAGTTSAHGSTPMTTAMHFRIGDITRSMTCTVLLALVDAGAVKLSDPATKYLPEMVDIAGITLEQLCQNTAGIGDYSSALSPQFVNNPTRDWPQLELVTDGLAEKRPGAPGAVFSDSDAGYILLGMALERATGLSWTALYRSYVFDPLAMRDTSFPESNPHAFPAPHPQGYATALTDAGALRCGTTVNETGLSATMAWTAGGVISSLSDLKTYAQALATGALLSKESRAAQWSTVSQGAGVPTWQGYGLGVETLGPLRGHDGAIPGFVTSILSDPKSGLTVVVMLNDSSAGAAFAQTLAMQLASIASKAPAAKGTAPVLALPWSQQQAAAKLASIAVCPAPTATATPAP